MEYQTIESQLSVCGRYPLINRLQRYESTAEQDVRLQDYFSMERSTQTQKKLIGFFKQFVNTTLIHHFKHSEETLTEWNYFSSLLGQECIDIDKIQLYLQVLSPKDPPISPSKLQVVSKLKTQENQKTNSGIYSKKNQTIIQVEKIEFQPNRTVGGNLDRAKYTGIVSQKPSMYTFDPKERKRVERGESKSGGLMALIQGMTVLNNEMLQNHLRLESRGENGNKSVNLNVYRAQQRNH